MENQLRVEVQREGDVAVLALSGELDLSSSAKFEAELDRIEDWEPALVIVDLRELEFMDSTGLSVLVRAHQRAQDSGKRFGLVNGPPQVQRLLNLTGVSERMAVAQTPEELLGGD